MLMSASISMKKRKERTGGKKKAKKNNRCLIPEMESLVAMIMKANLDK